MQRYTVTNTNPVNPDVDRQQGIVLTADGQIVSLDPGESDELALQEWEYAVAVAHPGLTVEPIA